MKSKKTDDVARLDVLAGYKESRRIPAPLGAG
jgi:hypothetical protein